MMCATDLDTFNSLDSLFQVFFRKLLQRVVHNLGDIPRRLFLLGEF